MPEPGILIHLLGKKPDEVDRILFQPEMRSNLSTALHSFADWIDRLN